jgi:hypothetical protein
VTVLRGRRLALLGVPVAAALVIGSGGCEARDGGGARSVAPPDEVPRLADTAGLDAPVRDAIATAAAAVEQRPADASAWGELGIV